MKSSTRRIVCGDSSNTCLVLLASCVFFCRSVRASTQVETKFYKILVLILVWNFPIHARGPVFVTFPTLKILVLIEKKKSKNFARGGPVTVFLRKVLFGSADSVQL